MTYITNNNITHNKYTDIHIQSYKKILNPHAAFG